MQSLRGKYISFLGASTSTFEGFSNNAQFHSTLPSNAAYYPKDFLNDVKDTWWMKTVDALGLNLCVNNSWSGSCVTTMVDGEHKAGCMERATALHNDRLSVEPDIIVLIIGGNDALRGYEIGSYDGADDIYDSGTRTYIGDCTLFGQAYATMVHKVKDRYPTADVYVCSMLHWQPKKHDKGLLEYNAVIQRISEEFQVTYVDFYNETDISPETAHQYLHTDGVHPNKHGFEQMSNCMIKLLQSRYTEKA
jgi:lysophospholipase L1-like esterase